MPAGHLEQRVAFPRAYSRYRDRLLEKRGLAVVAIPWFDWERDTSAASLRTRIDAARGAPPPSDDLDKLL